MLELSFKYKGKMRYIYGASLEIVSDKARQLFKNDEHSYKYDHSDENFIKEFLKGKLRYHGAGYEYFEDIPEVWDMSYSETESFVHSLPEDLKQFVKLDRFNDLYYVYNKFGAWKISEKLTKLAEDFRYNDINKLKNKKEANSKITFKK
jgi:hypothetical protein